MEFTVGTEESGRLSAIKLEILPKGSISFEEVFPTRYKGETCIMACASTVDDYCLFTWCQVLWLVNFKVKCAAAFVVVVKIHVLKKNLMVAKSKSFKVCDHSFFISCIVRHSSCRC